MTHPKLFRLSHGWATKYYWFSLVQDVYVGMDFVDGIKKGELTLEIDTGTTEADSHGCTMALTFFSERITSVFESHSSKSFNKYPIHFTKEANIQGNYFFIGVVSKIPDVRAKDIFKEPDLTKYCKKNGVAKSDLLAVGTNITPLYADFSRWDGSDVFTINNTWIIIVTEKIQRILRDKKVYKNLQIEEIKFLSG
jgi:hypothetical protein